MLKNLCTLSCVMLISILAACSEPPIQKMADIFTEYDAGDNEETIKKYLTDNGYKCVKRNQSILLSSADVSGDFEGNKEFKYKTGSSDKYHTEYAELCFYGSDSIEVDIENLAFTHRSLKSRNSIKYFRFSEGTKYTTKPGIKSLVASCGVYDLCAENLTEFENILNETFSYDFTIANRKKVNWDDAAEFLAKTDNNNTFEAEYKLTFGYVYISLSKEGFAVTQNAQNEKAANKKAETDKINRIKQYGAASVYKPNSVTVREFNKYIRLQCGTTVDCSNHSSVVSQVAAAYRGIKNSPNRYAKGYASACLDGFSALRTLSSHLHGDVGIYPAQFMACNEAMRYHFVKN